MPEPVAGRIHRVFDGSNGLLLLEPVVGVWEPGFALRLAVVPLLDFGGSLLALHDGMFHSGPRMADEVGSDGKGTGHPADDRAGICDDEEVCISRAAGGS